MKRIQFINGVKEVSDDFRVKENMYLTGIKGKMTQIFYDDILIANISESEMCRVYRQDLFKYHIPDLNLVTSLIASYARTPLDLR